MVNAPEDPRPLYVAFRNYDSPLLSVLRAISTLPNRGLQCLRVGARLANVTLPRTAAREATGKAPEQRGEAGQRHGEGTGDGDGD